MKPNAAEILLAGWALRPYDSLYFVVLFFIICVLIVVSSAFFGRVMIKVTGLFLTVRFPALFLGLIGGLIAASIVTNFEDMLNSYIILASFIPVIVYLTDAIGTQSQTLVVRLLALEPDFSTLRYIVREVKIGLILGIIFAIMLFIAEFLGWQQIKLGIVVGIAVFFSMAFQAFFATYFSIMLAKLKKDPALASGPLATIISDITTIVMYFSIAIIILESL